MKFIYIVSMLTFLFISPTTRAQVIEGYLNCTVTGSTVEESEEGKYKTYTGVKNGAKVGSKTILIYKVSKYSVSMTMNIENEEKTNIISDLSVGYERGSDYRVKRFKNSGLIVSYSPFDFSISLSPDYIRIDNFAELVLKRYYKNDWHGMYVRFESQDLLAVILTFNCRHSNDRLDEALNLFSRQED